ncbi:12109_t:CDS:2, partial [Funneliformis geosporum]
NNHTKTISISRVDFPNSDDVGKCARNLTVQGYNDMTFTYYFFSFKNYIRS